MAVETYPTPVEGWTCFHCGTHFAGTFKGWQEALHHFGENVQGDAWCQYTAKQVRAMEALLRGYQQEDTPRDRYLHKIQAENAVALRRAEEEGYARGLRDATEQSAVEREAQKPSFACSPPNRDVAP